MNGRDERGCCDYNDCPIVKFWEEMVRRKEAEIRDLEMSLKWAERKIRRLMEEARETMH